MADFGSPVAQNVDVNPARGIQTLSGLLGLRQQQLALQTGQAALPGIQAQAQQEQQTARQRQGIAAFMSTFDPTKHVGADGTLDLDNVLTDPALRQAAGDQFPALMQQMVQVKQSQLQAKQQLVNLNDATRTQFQTIVGGLRTDPDVIADNPAGRQKVKQAISQFAATGPDAARVAQIYGAGLDQVPRGRLAQSISDIQLQAQDASAQAANQRPQYIQTGNVMRNINPQAAPGGGGPSLTGSPNIAAGAAPTYLFDPVSKTYYLAPGSGGGTGPTTAPPPRQAPPQNAPPNAPPAQPPGNAPAKPETPGAAGLPHYEPGEANVVETNTATATKNRQLAADAQTQMDILNRIQAIAKTPGLYTGPGSQDIAQVATALAGIPGFEKAAQYANNYNELVKFMAQNAARMGAQMGLEGSDARLDLALHSQPNQAMDPRTIQSVSQYISGLVRMQLAKTDAMDRWLSQPGHSYRNEQNFERLWRDNADPRLFQMAVMQDQGEANQYSRLHIRQNELQTLQQKHDVLQALGAL
jgi:hypothetical protein